jgi:hypothetical protein
MKGIADDYLEQEISELRALFELHANFESKKYAEPHAKRGNDIRGQMQVIKELCRFASGAVHPNSANTKDEKQLADDLVKQTRDKFKKAEMVD